MRILVDTQCWLWMVAEPSRLSEAAAERLRDPANELLLSAASAWEIAIKCSIGRLDVGGDPAAVVAGWMGRSGVTPLPVLHSHALHVAELPPHHADPFDRLLVAQGQLEGVPIMTSDRALRKYDVEILPA